MRVFVTGDTHIPYDISKLASTEFPEGLKLTKEDVVIVVGDFGLLWSNEPDKTEKYWTKWLNDKPWTTLFLDGNHENHPRLAELETVQMFGNDVGKVSDSIFHLRRARIYEIGGMKTFVLGGAESIDKHHRTEGISWWPEEIPSREEFDRAYDIMEENDWSVDLILTHTLPKVIIDSIFDNDYGCQKGADPTTKFLDIVLENSQFGHWFCGHVHCDQTVHDQLTILYQKVQEIKL